MFRFLSGIVLVQLITTGLVITAFNWSDDLQLVIIIGFFALMVAFLTAFWFVSIANDIHKDEMVRMQQEHARDREQILVSTEREKAAIVTQSFQQIEKQTKRTHAKANFKIGVAFTLAAGAGTVMLVTQFVTLGLIILVTSGGVLSGYLARARQERLAVRKQPIINLGKHLDEKSELTRTSLIKRE